MGRGPSVSSVGCARNCEWQPLKTASHAWCMHVANRLSRSLALLLQKPVAVRLLLGLLLLGLGLSTPGGLTSVLEAAVKLVGLPVTWLLRQWLVRAARHDGLVKHVQFLPTIMNKQTCSAASHKGHGGHFWQSFCAAWYTWNYDQSDSASSSTQSSTSSKMCLKNSSSRQASTCHAHDQNHSNDITQSKNQFIVASCT